MAFLLLDKAKFAASFAADVKSETAAFMANSQSAAGVAALSGAVSRVSRNRSRAGPLVATDDRRSRLLRNATCPSAQGH